MQSQLWLGLDLTLYQLEEANEAACAAEASNGVVYTWGASGRSNWLTQGFSVANVLGYIILPHGLPNYIDLPDDLPAERDEFTEDDKALFDMLQKAATT